MSTVDPLLAAVERLRASVDALPEPLREPWETIPPRRLHVGVPIRDGGSSFFAAAFAEYEYGGDEDRAIAEHIALTADPRKVLLLADLLDEIEKPSAESMEQMERGLTILAWEIRVRKAARALASHLTEGTETGG